MASMIDVVFLLLIYFLVTAERELPEAHLTVNLPSQKSAPAEERIPKVLEIEIYPTEIFLQGAPRSMAFIKDTLSYFAELEADQTVLIKVSPDAQAHQLVEVLDLCNGVGLSNLNLVSLE